MLELAHLCLCLQYDVEIHKCFFYIKGKSLELKVVCTVYEALYI